MNSTLALNAIGGARNGGPVKLFSNCPVTNPDCLWIYRQGMIVSAANPRLAIKAGSTNLTALKLSDTCTPTDVDCNWIWSKGLFRTTRGTTFMMNALGGAQALGTVAVNSACTETNPDCTWTLDSAPVTIGWSSNLGVNAYGGVTSGEPLKLYSHCPTTNQDCTWQFKRGLMHASANTSFAATAAPVLGHPITLTTLCTIGDLTCQWTWKGGQLLSDANNSFAINAWGGANHTTTLKLHNQCSSGNPDCVFEAGWSVTAAAAFPAIVSTGNQSETAVDFSYASTTDSTQMVVFNDFAQTDNIPSQNNRFGYAFFDSASASPTWITHKVPLPGTQCGPPSAPCWARLVGDPAVAVNPFDKNYVYAYMMASSRDATTAATDSFCVARWTDRGRTYPPPVVECHKSNDAQPFTGVASNLLDGEAMAASPLNGAVVIGYHNVGANPAVNQTDDQVDLWYTCNTLSTSGSSCGPNHAFRKGTGAFAPFPGRTCVGHPRLSFFGGYLHVIVQTVENALVYNRALIGSPPGGGTNGFQTPVVIQATRNAGPGFTVPAQGKSVTVGPFYSIASGINESGFLEARIAYTEFLSGHYHVRYARCMGASCVRVTAWDTINYPSPHTDHDEFFPEIAYANGVWKVAYLSTWNSPDHLEVAYQKLSGDGTPAHPYLADTPKVLPGSLSDCPRGDFNSIAYNGTSNAFVYAYDVPVNGSCSTGNSMVVENSFPVAGP